MTLWNKDQQAQIDRFISELKNIEWFKQAGEPSPKYMAADSIYEACDTYGKQMRDVWGRNSENTEAEALKTLSDAQVDSIFETVSLAIGNELYEGLYNLEERLDEDAEEMEMEILDFIKRDTAWACIELLIGQKDFFTRVYDINKTGRWACSWVGKFPAGNFIIM